jgi:hypothetical protein
VRVYQFRHIRVPLETEDIAPAEDEPITLDGSS